jgi:hypothetical protein
MSPTIIARRGGGGGVGYSAMARTVGLPAAMAAQLILERILVTLPYLLSTSLQLNE